MDNTNLKASDVLSRKKQIFFRVIIIFVFLLISGEILARTFGEIYRSPWERLLNDYYNFSADYGWLGPPSSEIYSNYPDGREPFLHSYNSHGWSDVEHSLAKPDGILRILFLGDSATEGIVDLKDVYTRQVERILKEKGYSVEVISMGLGGWGTDQQLLALEKEGVKYSPDIVISQFCGNDVSDILSTEEEPNGNRGRVLKSITFSLEGDKLKRNKKDPDKIFSKYNTGRQKLKNFFFSSALIYNLYSLRYYSVRKKKNSNNSEKPVSCSEESRNYRWALYTALIRETKCMSENSGALFFAFSQGGHKGIGDWLAKENRLRMDEDGTYYYLWQGKKYEYDPFAKLENRLEKAFRDAGVIGIPNIRKYERFVYDPHPNEKGNLSIALDITEFLLETRNTSKKLAEYRK